MFGCKHFYGKVQDDGYQYCTKCSKAIAAPVKPPEPAKICTHSWVTEVYSDQSDRFTNNFMSRTYMMKCNNCGDVKKERLTTGDYV